MNTIATALDRASSLLWDQGEIECAEAVAAVAATLDPSVGAMSAADPIEILKRAALRFLPTSAQ